MISFLTFDINFMNLTILFLWTIGSSLGVPGALVAMISYGAIARHPGQLVLIMAVAFTASIIGDIIAYELARKLSTPLLKSLRKFSFFKKKEVKAHKLLGRYEFLLIFFTRFAATGLCAPVSYISGFEKLNRRKFYLGVFSGEALYALIYPTIGYLFGATLNDLLKAINYFLITIVLIVIMIYLLFKLIKMMRRLRKISKEK